MRTHIVQCCELPANPRHAYRRIWQFKGLRHTLCWHLGRRADPYPLTHSFWNPRFWKCTDSVSAICGSLTPIRGNRTVYGIVKRKRTLSILFLFVAATFHASAQGDAAPSIEYRNAHYGFCFSLPASWKGYSIMSDQWDGSTPDSQNVTHGPRLRIRNPKWTEKDPYEDIPILVFTHAEWNLVTQEKLNVSAAPIGPSELGSNARYVFALPPRYNFDYATGWQEVEDLIQRKSLHAPCGMRTNGQ